MWLNASPENLIQELIEWLINGVKFEKTRGYRAAFWHASNSSKWATPPSAVLVISWQLVVRLDAYCLARTHDYLLCSSCSACALSQAVKRGHVCGQIRYILVPAQMKWYVAPMHCVCRTRHPLIKSDAHTSAGLGCVCMSGCDYCKNCMLGVGVVPESAILPKPLNMLQVIRTPVSLIKCRSL